MYKILLAILFAILFCININAQESKFDISKDLLILQLDCKTDVDDLHTAAGLATILKHPDYKDLNYFAVAGTYGIQKGLYVPPNELMKMAFKGNWTDADKEWEESNDKVVSKALNIIKNGGSIWIAEAGQSDFTADWVKKIRKENPSIKIRDVIHVVQHSDWNESVAKPVKLMYVKTATDYHKIADGNAVGNGTPGFKSDVKVDWESKLNDEHLTKVWNTAIRLGNKYNGMDGRYLNESVAEGGLDFSDLSEVCYILDLIKVKDTDEFFTYFMVD
ncbi:hypothetical protein [Maribacter sp. Asnod1-A12]|uniref:hypothetical protein n=1 Tax=Maribacter sp. Asnod1-A12 TaxID=3160576 RepID=UPI0038691B66